MQQSVYATPKTHVVDQKTTQVEQEFYVVSMPKFWTLLVSTMGMYSIYWFFQHWSLYKKYNQTKMIPFLRSIFSVFFIHKLYENIDNSINSKNYDYTWSPNIYAALYIITSVGDIVFKSFVGQGIMSPRTSMITWLSTPILFYVLYRGQLAANVACGDQYGESNSKFTVINIICIAISFILWIGVLISIKATTSNMSY